MTMQCQACLNAATGVSWQVTPAWQLQAVLLVDCFRVLFPLNQ